MNDAVGQPMTLADIENLTTAYARAREDLKTCLDTGEAECEAVRRRYRPMLKRRADRVAALGLSLRQAIEDNRALFTRPKTRTWSAVRVGLMKQRGKITVADKEATIRHIERYYPEQAKAAIKTTKSLIKSAIGGFTADALKKCGIAVGEDADAPIVKPVDGQLEKLVAGWLEGEEADGD